MKSACFSWFAALAVIAGCGSDDASAPDDAPVCTGLNGMSVIDSLDVGTLSNTDAPDELVPWENGDVVELERGSQGFVMLVATGVARGAGLHRDSPYVQMELVREDGTIGAENNIFGGASETDPRGAWYTTESYLTFVGDWEPDEGEVMQLRVHVDNCIELQRRLVISRPSP